MGFHGRGAGVLILAAAVAAVATISPAGAALPKAVKGTAVQTFRASYAIPQTSVTPKSHRDYFFTGGPTDSVGVLAGGAASFTTTHPGAGQASIQEIFPLGISEDAPSAARWSGPLSARIHGPMTFTWWWATEDPVAKGADNAELTVIADEGTPRQTMLGQAQIPIGELGPVPSELTHSLYLEGVVRETLTVTVRPRYIDASHDLRVYYGSADYPSRFALPLGVTPKRSIPPNLVLSDSHPLKVITTYIGRNSSEPTIGITRSGNAFVTAADFDGLSPVTPRTKIYGSFDGNKSWRDVSPTAASGGLDYPPTTLDPYLYVDTDTGRLFSDDLTAACSILIYSDDQGKTWSPGNPAACEGPVDDHQTIVAGPPPQGRATRGYPNVLYYCVNKVAGSTCAASLDGGTTFLASGTPAFTGVDPTESGTEVCGGLHGHIVTDKAGRLYMPKGHCGRPWLAVSEDLGQTWRRTLVSPSISASDVQTAVAIDSAGNVYYTWWDAIDHLPYLAVSRNAGKTFSRPVMIAPPGVLEVNLVSVSAGTKGQVAISFPGTRDGVSAHVARPWHYYVMTTSNALDTLPIFRSSTAQATTDPIHRGLCQGRCAGMFDFLDVKIAPNGDVWAPAVDTCTKACARASDDAKRLTPGEQPSDARGVVTRILNSVAWAPRA